MNFSEVVKQIEQFIFELLMWVIFYPYTLVRVLFRPTKMLRYVGEEITADPDTAFGNAIRPPLFLFLCIAIGSVIAPIGAEQAKVLAQNEVGRLLNASWINLLAFRTLGFSAFALAGALIIDLITPGTVTRNSLKLPFYQQCYVCGPFALGFSPTLVRLDTGTEVLLLLLLAFEIWLLVVQTLFFRRMAGTGRIKSALLASAVLLIGNVSLVAIPVIANAVMP